MERRSALMMGVMLVTFLSGCASQQNYAAAVRGWQGAGEKQLFNIWGYPNQIQKLDNGHRLLVYRTVNKGTYPTVTTPGYTAVDTAGGRTSVTSTSSMTTGGGSYNFRCTTWFEVNRQGRVVNTSFRGNGCEATDAFVRSHRRL